ncbi:MAG: efflux RND transporter periplasmic adaptor subunit [Casimicrobiaceae bacterium]|nr:efflux RND transporter periplasmic adaptor subunit [Casimicrobiaceae bacterium]
MKLLRPSIESSRWAVLRPWALGLTVAAGVALLALGVKGQTAPRAPAASAASVRPALTVTLASVESSPWPLTLSANGNIAAWQEAVIGAEVQGLRIAEVHVQVGDRVRKGQVLATFAAETLEAERAQAAALIAEAEAQLAQAEADAARARLLADSGALSAQQINQFQTAEKTARARLAAARAQMQLIEVRRAQTRLVAPDDGVISARSATLGAVVGPGVELFRLIRQGRLEWRAEVTAAELSRLRTGQAALVTLSDGSQLRGRVRQLAPTVDPQTRNALVYVDLERSPQARPGVFARGEFELGRTSALHVPQSALVLRDGFAYVFRADASGRVSQVKVETGRRLGDRVEIVSGLKPGEQVVASGAAFLSDGDSVRVAAQPSVTASGPERAQAPAGALGRP